MPVVAVIVVEARYPGVCSVCDEPFEVGTRIRSAGTRPPTWRHEVCPELAEPDRPGYLAPRTSVDDMGY